ncbi:hypothetical protein ACKAV7_003410 [Fusarium commune]
MKLSNQKEILRITASPPEQVLLFSGTRQSQCVTDILDTIPAPTHPSTGTTARRRSSISRRVMRRRAATYRSRQPSPRRPTARSRTQGPNTQGWCTMPMSRMTMNPESFSVESVETTCDHGCCSKCVQYGSGRDASPEMTFSEIRKGSASRKFGYSSATKSHRRGSAFSLPASGGESTPSPSTSESSSASSGYKVGMEHTSSKTKSSKKRHKSNR